MKKITPKRLARKVLYDKIMGFCDFSQEYEDLDCKRGSPKFEAEFDRHIEKYLKRISKILGDGITDKLEEE